MTRDGYLGAIPAYAFEGLFFVCQINVLCCPADPTRASARRSLSELTFSVVASTTRLLHSRLEGLPLYSVRRRADLVGDLVNDCVEAVVRK